MYSVQSKWFDNFCEKGVTNMDAAFVYKFSKYWAFFLISKISFMSSNPQFQHVDLMLVWSI